MRALHRSTSRPKTHNDDESPVEKGLHHSHGKATTSPIDSESLRKLYSRKLEVAREDILRVKTNAQKKQQELQSQVIELRDSNRQLEDEVEKLRNEARTNISSPLFPSSATTKIY